MSLPYLDAPAVTLSIDRGAVQHTITLTHLSAAWASTAREWYVLMVDSTAYPLVPLAAQTDDPAAWAWAEQQQERVIAALVQLKTDARRAHPAQFSLVIVAPDVAFDVMGSDAALCVEDGADGLRVNGARVLAVERVGQWALVTVESPDDDDPPRPDAYLLRADALSLTPYGAAPGAER